jgi:hypothetical protein
MTVGVHGTNVATPWLQFLRGTNTTTAPSTIYVKLHTADPTAAGTGGAAVGSATRSAATFAAPSGNAIALTGTLPSWTNGGTSETLSHVSVWDALSGGNLLWTVALSSTQAWNSGNTFTLTTLGVSIAPIAV